MLSANHSSGNAVSSAMNREAPTALGVIVVATSVNGKTRASPAPVHLRIESVPQQHDRHR